MTNLFSKAVGGAFIAAAYAALAACGSDGGEAPQENAGDFIAAAIANPERAGDEVADDPLRKPAEVLAFTGVEPGMTVFEMEAGHGYYTELLSYIVGETGSIVMQNPPAFDSFAGAAVARRLDGNRLPNVRHARCNFDELTADDETVDIVTWFLGPHELYFMPAGVEDLGDEKRSYQEIYRVLKPGGYFVVLDHAAAPGAPKSTGGDTHRIDPAIVLALAEENGFELVDQSDILRNPDDNYDLGVFHPEVRRKTDRFLFKFRKPA